MLSGTATEVKGFCHKVDITGMVWVKHETEIFWFSHRVLHLKLLPPQEETFPSLTPAA